VKDSAFVLETSRPALQEYHGLTMTFGRVLAAALAILVAVAAVVFWVQREKSRYHDGLVAQADALVGSGHVAPPIAIPVSAQPPAGGSAPRTFAMMEGSQVREFRHFSQGTLRAVEILDNGGRVARRDIFDGEYLRVRLFFNERGELVRRIDYDERGRESTARLFVPVAGIRAGY
jgi:hypothetical protein